MKHSIFFKKLAIACLMLMATMVQAQAPYIITGSGTQFTVTRNGATVGLANQSLSMVIYLIQSNANGAACTIQFGNGTNTLDIGGNYIEFDGSGSGWGAITLTGKLTSSRNTLPFAAINMVFGVSVSSSADITNTDANGEGIRISRTGTYPGGTLEITGGKVSAAGNGSGSSAINNFFGGTVNITGGMVEATGNGNAISNNGTVNISGGIVKATTGFAVSDNNGTVRLTGGIVFAYGTSTGNVISGGYMAGSGNNVIVAWNQAAGNNTYTVGESTDIFRGGFWQATAVWSNQDGSGGIAVAISGTNTGFIPLQAVSVQAPPPTYNITVSANPTTGGSVSGGGTNIAHGTSVTVNANPNACYNFVNWTENGTQVSTNASYNFTATTNRTLVANFTLKTYNIAATANPTIGGSVSGGGTVNCGSTVTLTATPNIGYDFVNWTENGTQVSTNATYTFTASTNRTLVANFTLKTYNIIATAGANGTINPSGTITVTHGSNKQFTFAANTNYEVDKLFVDDVNIADSIAGGRYTFNNVMEGHTIEVTFKPIPIITLNLMMLNLGNVIIGTTSAPQSITISGADLRGDITYAISGFDAAAFDIDATAWNAEDGGTLVITFSPTEIRAYNAAITFNSADAESKTVILTGTGLPILVTGVEMFGCPEIGWLNLGETVQLSMEITPDNASNKNVIWSSSNINTAIVTQTGLVTTTGVGAAHITVKTLDGGFTASCYIRVIRSVTGVTLNKTATTLSIGNEETLIATVLPANATIKTVTWDSSNPTVATVNDNGKITALAVGTTTITVTTTDGEFTAECTVTVVASYITPTGITVTPKTLTLDVGSLPYPLFAEIKPVGANPTVTWTSNATAIATVDANGNVTALAAGKATITAKTVNGYSATCTVTVTVPIDSIVITPAECTLALKGTKTLKATVYPDNATNKTITWSSENTAIATVSSTGTVTAKNINGIVEIYATNTASGIVGVCIVTVGTGIPAPPLAITETDETNIMIYPNPTTGELKIMNNKQLTVNNVEIYDVLGRLVFTSPNPSEEGKLATSPLERDGVRLNVSHLPTGVYFLRIGDKTAKFVKE